MRFVTDFHGTNAHHQRMFRRKLISISFSASGAVHLPDAKTIFTARELFGSRTVVPA
jgi:hypothetical protein